MRKVLVALLALLFTAPIPPSHAEEPVALTVMSRNLYLGSDVGVAMKLLPNFPAAAQFMWDQVKVTDFAQRAPLLAKEAARIKPDVIGIQEATIWYCKKDLWSGNVEVFNFLDQLIKETKQTGVGYSLAKLNSKSAFNPGYSIAAIPYLTKVVDPQTFRPLFKQDSASCGFTIGDALLVRDDRMNDIKQLGNSEYEATYSIIPTLMTIYRGYSWLDLASGKSTVRIVTTHLESIWDHDVIPNSVLQARQLVEDLKATTMPLIVMGDFNADYRDPRAANESNPGEQPVVGKACPKASARDCNAYWTMIDGGFINASPDVKDPKNFTWGAGALLDGPDANRVKAAETFGNSFGFTDRLDYIFTKNVLGVRSTEIFGNTWPTGESIWKCGNKDCFASDHAGVAATILLDDKEVAINQSLPTHSRFPIGPWQAIGAALLIFLMWRIVKRK